MTAGADPAWRAIVRQIRADLRPFPGRFAMTWRVALLCALVAGVAMLYKIPESAIGCYLIIYLARPDGAECVAQALGIIVLASIVVLALAPLIAATADEPLLRITAIALISFVFVFLGAATQLGESGSIIALVVVFILTLVDLLPAGEIATRALIYAWKMACVPMVMMIGFNLLLGTSPHRLLRRTVEDRLAAAAAALDVPGDGGAALRAALADGNAEVGQRAMLAGLFHTAPSATRLWLRGAAMNAYALLLAVAAIGRETPEAVRAELARRCRERAATIAAGGRPEAGPHAGLAAPGAAVAAAERALDGFGRPDGGTDQVPLKPPFLLPDAFTNPEYPRFALKTTAAALGCYLIYSLLDWRGIHTAMVTCYVAALGTTAETVHKLALRIVGCLLGAGIGFLAILFVIPQLESVGGLMLLVFAAILPAAWVSSGSERISYAGVQIGLAFLLTVLHGFGPSLSMESGRDRIIGVLLGNLMVYLVFTGIWPKSAVADARDRTARALAALGRIAAGSPDERQTALSDAEIAHTEAGRAAAELALLPFEPKAARPPAPQIEAALRLLETARLLAARLMFASGPTGDAAARLAALARRVGGRPASGA